MPQLPPEELERRRSPVRAPRSQQSWEPTPLHIPVPEPMNRNSSRNEQPKPSRGVVIIDYGSDDE